jgi:hypothetical protein
MRVAHIEWIDSEADIGWEKPEYESDWLGRCHSVGFVVAETDNYVVLANSVESDHGECNGRISIPRSSILKMRTLCQIKTTN